MKTLFLLLCCLLAGRVTAQERVIPSTPFTRTLLRSADAATARSILGTGASSNAVTLADTTNAATTVVTTALTALNADNLTSGTVPDARFPATLPAASGVNLTALNAANLGSGTIPDARFPATLPAASGVNLTALTAANITPPDTIAWAAGSLTLGWPTRYHTHSITSNSWVTGFSGGVAGKTLSAFLTVTNATSTDYTLSVSNSVTTTDGLRSWTCTNKSSRGFSFGIGTQSNGTSQPFY